MRQCFSPLTINLYVRGQNKELLGAKLRPKVRSYIAGAFYQRISDLI